MPPYYRQRHILNLHVEINRRHSSGIYSHAKASANARARSEPAANATSNDQKIRENRAGEIYLCIFIG